MMNEQNSLDVALAFVAKINSHDVNGVVELMTGDHDIERSGRFRSVLNGK